MQRLGMTAGQLRERLASCRLPDNAEIVVRANGCDGCDVTGGIWHASADTGCGEEDKAFFAIEVSDDEDDFRALKPPA
jgi:hypothetical protein